MAKRKGGAEKICLKAFDEAAGAFYKCVDYLIVYRNKKKSEKLEIKKFSPQLRKHVLYKEAKFPPHTKN